MVSNPYQMHELTILEVILFLDPLSLMINILYEFVIMDHILSMLRNLRYFYRFFHDQINDVFF
jgi:hypothetical protein